MKTKKMMYKKAILRRQWVEFLREHKLPDKTRTTQELTELFCWVEQTRIEEHALKHIIQANWEQTPSEL